MLATGSSAVGEVPWKAVGDVEETKQVLHKIQEQVKSAKSIAIGGGGATGCEVAGELTSEYGRSKEVTLVSLAFGIWRRLGAGASLESLAETIVFGLELTATVDHCW